MTKDIAGGGRGLIKGIISEFPWKGSENHERTSDSRAVILSSTNVSVGIQSNTTCYSSSSGVYYTSSDVFRPYHNGHLQASILGGVVNTIVIYNIRDLVSCATLAVYYHILVGGVVVK
jgi:hypothetical protein